MLAKYTVIKDAYDKFYNELLASGRLPLKDTGEGFWGIAAADDLIHLFKKINLDSHKSFLDLGSGDGKVVMIASLFTNATGIEIDRELHDKAVEIKNKLGLKKASLINGNYMDHDLSKYDVVFINPDKRMTQLEPKLLRELKGKLVVYNHLFHPEVLRKEMEFVAHTTPVAIFRNLDGKS